MPCRIGHQEGDPVDLFSMSRRDILGITGVSALTLATGAAASLLVAGCEKTKEADSIKKHEAEPSLDDYIPCLGVIALYPANVSTFKSATDNPLKKGNKCFYLPYYSEYLDKKRLQRGTMLTCRVVLIGCPPVAAMAVNVSAEEFPKHDHARANPHADELDTILTNLGYGRRYLEGHKFTDFITNEECKMKPAEQDHQKKP
jgi:hypothetical protein